MSFEDLRMTSGFKLVQSMVGSRVGEIWDGSRDDCET
jgi:hypothetical protein